MSCTYKGFAGRLVWFDSTGCLFLYRSVSGTPGPDCFLVGPGDSTRIRTTYLKPLSSETRNLQTHEPVTNAKKPNAPENIHQEYQLALFILASP